MGSVSDHSLLMHQREREQSHAVHKLFENRVTWYMVLKILLKDCMI